MSRRDALFALVVGAVILAATVIHWLRLTLRGAPPVEIDRLPASAYEFQVDINHATWVEWMQLEGIGEITARRIVADREQRGPFASVDDLDRVPGIGPKTLAAIRPFLHCRDCDSPA
jgi:competence protein ComEA